MTHNQINYWNYQETSRHNLADEKETNRHNVTSEVETNRHNVATETETYRHNVTTEGIDLSKLSETKRHNMATENLGRGQLQEDIRHNVAGEQLNLGNLSETIRHNASGEAELNRHNISIENESQRHNLASEAGIMAGIRQQYASLNELMRHNIEQEGLQWNQLQVDKFRAESDSLLKESQRLLNNANRVGALSTLGLNKGQIQAQIDLANANRDKAVSDTGYISQKAGNDWMRSVSQLINTLGNILHE